MQNGIFYSRPDKYKYSMAFTSKVNPIVSNDFDKYLSIASQDKFKKYLPKNIDFEKKVDFLGVCGEAFLANKLNLNDDGIATDEAILVKNLFPLSFIDANHDRTCIIGVVVDSSYAEYGTGKELTEEEVKKLKSPFSVILSGIIWRVANPDLTNIVEASSDPSSEWYNKIFYSWELGFSNSNLIVIDANKTNFEDGTIITDEREISKLESKLKAFGGNGRTGDGKKIGRIPIGDIIPLGVGVVENPAGQLQPITTNNENNNSNAKKSSYGTCPECGVSTDRETTIDPENQDNIICGACQKSSNAKKWKKGVDTEIIEEKANKNDITSSVDIKILTEEVIKLLENDKKYENIAKSLSQIEISAVKSNSNKFMKVKNIKDLTGESLKEITASEVQELYAQDLKQQLDSEIKKISDDFEAKKAEKDNAIKSANAEIIKLGESVKDINNKYTELDKKAKEVEDNYNKLVKANQEKEKVEVFSARLQTMDEEFNLSEEEKKIVGDELKAIDSDEAFAAYKAKMDVLLAKSKKVFDPKTKKWVNKEDLKDKGKDDSMENPDGTKKTAKASTNVVDEVSKEGKVVTPTIPNTSSAEKTLTERALEAFGASGWSFEPSKRNRKSNN